jgi:hypothetical protein
MDERRTSLFAPIAIVLLLTLLLMAYVGIYFITVKKIPAVAFSTAGTVLYLGETPHYGGVHSRFIGSFFWPIHWLDRHVRSSYWDEAG